MKWLRFMTRTNLGIKKWRLTNGSKVFARVDWDGVGGLRPILNPQKFKRKILYEFDHSRLPIVGISTEPGVGHMVTLIGLAMPVGLDPVNFKPDDIVGYVIYDPFTAKTQLMADEELYKIHKVLVYVTLFNNWFGANIGAGHTTLKQKFNFRRFRRMFQE